MTIFLYIVFFLFSSIFLFIGSLNELKRNEAGGLLSFLLCLISIVHLFYWGYNPKIMIWILTITFLINMHTQIKQSRLALIYLLVVFPGLYLIFIS